MRRFTPTLLPLLCLIGCGPAASDDDDDDATVAEPCVYPVEYAEPMEFEEVLAPYSWPTALSFDRTDIAISLERVFCNEDDIDWSPFDVLLFVSYPAW